jgi:hypothetical protein
MVNWDAQFFLKIIRRVKEEERKVSEGKKGPKDPPRKCRPATDD